MIFILKAIVKWWMGPGWRSNTIGTIYEQISNKGFLMIEIGIRLDPIWHSQVTITWGGFIYKGLITEWGAKCGESRRRLEKLRANTSRALLAWRKKEELLKTRGSKSCATNVTRKRAITCCPRQLQVASQEQILWYHSLSLPSPAKAEINPINSQSL